MIGAAEPHPFQRGACGTAPAFAVADQAVKPVLATKMNDRRIRQDHAGGVHLLTAAGAARRVRDRAVQAMPLVFRVAPTHAFGVFRGSPSEDSVCGPVLYPTSP